MLVAFLLALAAAGCAVSTDPIGPAEPPPAKTAATVCDKEGTCCSAPRACTATPTTACTLPCPQAGAPEQSSAPKTCNGGFFCVVYDNKGGSNSLMLNCTGRETVLDAINLIGGVPANGSQYKVWVARPSPTNPKNPTILPVDWRAIAQNHYMATNYRLVSGDCLYVKAETAETPPEQVYGPAPAFQPAPPSAYTLAGGYSLAPTPVAAPPGTLESPQKLLAGNWEREVKDCKISLRIEEGRLFGTCTFREPKDVFAVSIDADFQITKDSVLYGVITGCEATGTDEAAMYLDVPFSARVRLDGDSLTVKGVKFLERGLKNDDLKDLAVLEGRYKRRLEAKGSR
jgi:hypothetical protein